MSCKTDFILNLMCFSGATEAHIQSLHVVISHICTEQLGKKLWPYNKATLLQLIQRDCKNNNGFSVATEMGFTCLWSFTKMGFSVFAVKRSNETFKDV